MWLLSDPPVNLLGAKPFSILAGECGCRRRARLGGRTGRGGQEQVQPEVARLVEVGPQPAPHGSCPLARYGKTKPPPSGGRGPRRVGAVKAVENLLGVRLASSRGVGDDRLDA